MMKKTLITAVFAFVALIATMASPQQPSNNPPQLPSDNKVKVGQPAELRRNILKKSDLDSFVKTGKWGQDNVVNEYWNVWSDRSHNTTYNGPSESSGKFKELRFNQSLRIADIQKGYALVYEEVMNMAYPVISTRAECLGWVKMDNLLLWQDCPTNDLGIYHKALIVANVEGWGQQGKETNIDKSYKNYVTKDGTEPVKADMTFYFVMKDVGDFVLLATTSKMGDGITDKHLYAWVNKNTYVPWDQRTCLEGNWDPDVADNLKGQKVGVYRGEKLGTYIELGIENGTKNRATKYRFKKARLRFPLLKTEGNQYGITAFAKPHGGDAVLYEEEQRDIDEADKLEDAKAKLLEDNKVINLIIVIDGTSSMNNYYKPMQEAIQNAYETFGGKNGVKVRAGVVIYRDYADGEYMVETLPMTDPTSNILKEFMTNGGKYGIKSSPKDHTAAEALYQGLNAALDAKHMGYSNVNSNLMFVVGDCGNAANDAKIDPQEIVAKCAELKVNLVAFQVRNKDDAAFNDFRRQMGAIMRDNLKTQYKDIIKWKVSADGMVLKEIEGVSLPVMAAMRNADKGEEMSPQKLNSIIKENYIRFENVLRAKEDIIVNIEKYGKYFNQTGEAAESAANQLDSAFLDGIVTPELIEIINKRNLLTAFNGQTAQKANNGQDYWKPVLFITNDEFSELMEKLKLVYQGATAGTRKAYVEGLKALIRTFMPEISEQEMGQKDVKQVMDLVLGLTVKTKSLSNYTLLEIQDEKIVKQEEFDRLVADFKTKYEYLENIKSSDYEFSVLRRTSNVRWYWLPVEALP